jgi:hypothetical protein
MTLISSVTISECIHLLKNDKLDTEMIGWIYKLSQFHGLRKCIQVWDKMGLKRRHDPIYDTFFKADRPCILCNPGAEPIIARYKIARERLSAIKARMSQLEISDHTHKAFNTKIDYMVDRYAELIQSRAEHIARRKPESSLG